MEEQSPLRVRCKHGSLVVADGHLSLDPGLISWQRPRWSVPIQEIRALSASRGIGVTFTLTFQTTDGHELRAEWLLPHDARRVATALGYSLTLYDLHEMAAEHELGAPFTYDLITLEPAAPAVTQATTAEHESQPKIEILAAGAPTPPPLPSVSSQPPRLSGVAHARLTTLATALWLVLRPAAARLLAAAAARVHAWQALHPAPARIPSQPEPLGLADALALLSAALSKALARARRALAPALASLQERVLRLASDVRATLRAQYDALRVAMQASSRDRSGAPAYVALLAALLPRLRNRLASAILVVALILAVIAASALQTSPPSFPAQHGTSPATGEVIGVLPHQAPGGLSKSAAPAVHASRTIAPPPTPTPPPPPPPALTLAITCAWAQNGQQGQVCVHTQPGAALTITITYCDGQRARNKSLQGTVSANSSGNYIWTWVPASRCIGPATAVVTAHWQGQTTTASTSFDVTMSALPPALPPATSPVMSV